MSFVCDLAQPAKAKGLMMMMMMSTMTVAMKDAEANWL